MLTSLIVRVVAFSQRQALAVILIALALAGVGSVYAATHFKMNTDTNQLLAADLPWRIQEKAMEHAFPQKTDLLLIAIDGDTPDAAEGAAAVLTEKLSAMPQLFTMVKRPDQIPYFQKNGILLLPSDDIGARMDQLVQAQPLLGMITSDPSLRGFFSTINLMIEGVKAGQMSPEDLGSRMGPLAETIGAALQGQDKPLPLQSMMAGAKPGPRDLRKYIVTKPVLDYSALEPGHAATDAIRNLVKDLSLTSDHGVHVRLTGSVPLNDEEFASVANGTGIATALSGVLVFLILLLALRSLRLILPILMTLLVGLAMTTGFALLALGSLNLISVAFAVMFIGIAVDFGIQFGVRYRDQHFLEPDHSKAMLRTAAIIAVPLAMAAASTSLGFLAFIPTSYRGVSELGLITGAGMLIAFSLNITLLPALLHFSKPPAEAESIGYECLAPIDKFLVEKRRGILIAAAVITVLGGLIASRLHFDFDPINLKDPHTESVSTLIDLMKDPDFNPYTIDVLRPNLEDAQKLAADLAKLPEVDHVMTLASFLPEDQDAKLAQINDTRALLEPTLNLPQQPAPTEAEIYGSITKLSDNLKQIGQQDPGAQQFAGLLDQIVAQHDPALLARLQNNLLNGLTAKLAQVKQILSITPVKINDITDDLRRDWVTPDQQYLVEAYPKGDARDTAMLARFTTAVRKIAPDAAGAPISIQESGHTIIHAFIEAGCYALLAIGLLAYAVLRRVRDAVLLILPLLMAGILTLATMVAIKLPLNFANIIALPLLLSLGVSYAIYFVTAWRTGVNYPLQTSMARAVLFSAATVLVSFASLSLSSHAGTAGMGELLTLALLYSLATTFFILPVLLGPAKPDKG